MSRTINMARTLANINDRAQRITEDYRLFWSGLEKAFFVVNKADFKRRYKVTAESCNCPSHEHHGDCKHHLGLSAMIEVEIKRYTLLGFAEKREQMEAFKEEIESAKRWKDEAYIAELAEQQEQNNLLSRCLY